MLKSNFEFEILINGRTAKEYYHKGSHYIEAREGSCFSLRMRNNSGHRALFVPTVDGLSIMNGKEASYKSQGYVISAHDSLTIDGWRTSDDKVAEFFFSSPKGSYASKKGKGGNLGVIGCAVFKEKERRPDPIINKEYIPYEKSCPYHPWKAPNWLGTTITSSCGGNSTSAINMYSAQAGSNLSGQSANLSASNPSGNDRIIQCSSANTAALGTGFGQDKYSPVTTVNFEKESHPTEVFTIFYNTIEKLEEIGVEFKKAVYIAPSAFPNEDGYCERPN